MCGAPHQGLEQGLESQPVCLVPAAGGGKCLYLFKPGVYFLTHFKLDQVASTGNVHCKFTELHLQYVSLSFLKEQETTKDILSATPLGKGKDRAA